MEHTDDTVARLFQEREGVTLALHKAIREILHCPEHHNTLRYPKFSTWKRQKDGSWA